MKDKRKRRRHQQVTSEKPKFLGVAILGRIDPDGLFEVGNVQWRTAVSHEEAELGTELHVGSDLRDRFLELEKQGWMTLTEEGRQQLDRFGGGGHEAQP